MFEFLSDWLWGYDFFISYSHADGALLEDGKTRSRFVRALAARLKEENSKFSIFVDETEYAPGTELTEATKRHVRASTRLLVIARHNALTSKWVHEEVKVAVESRVPIVIVDVNNCFSESPADNPIRLLVGDNILRHDELLANPDDEPSRKLVSRLADASARSTRQRRRLHAITATAILLAGLTLCFAVAALIAVRMRNEAEERARIAESRRLAIQSKVTTDRGDWIGGIELAIRSRETEPTLDSQDALLNALQAQPRLQADIPSGVDTITSIAYSTSGMVLYAGDTQGKVHKWDVRSHFTEHSVVADFGYGIRCLATQESNVIVAVRDSLFRISPSGGAPVKLYSHQAEVRSIATQTGCIASADINGNIRVRELTNGNEKSVSKSLPIYDLDFNQDGDLLAVSGKGSVCILNQVGETTELVSPSQANDAQHWGVEFSPSGDKLAICDEDGYVHFWNVAPAFELEQKVKVFQSGCISIAWQNRSNVLTGCSSGEIAMLSLDQNGWSVVERFQAHQSLTGALAMNPTKATFASGGHKGVRVWNIGTGQILASELASDIDSSSSIACGTSRVAVFSNEPISRRLISIATQTAVSGTRSVHQSQLAIGFNAKDEMFAAHVAGTRIVLDRTVRDSLAPIHEISHAVNIDTTETALGGMFTPNMSHLLVSYPSRKIELRDSRTGNLVAMLSLRIDNPRQPAIAVSDFGQLVVTTEPSIFKLQACSTYERILISTDVLASSPYSVAVSQDGALIAFGDHREIVMLEGSTSTTKLRLPTNESIHTLAISPNGKLVAGGGFDGVIYLWDVETGQQIGPPLIGHRQYEGTQPVLRSLVFSADSRHLLSLADDNRMLCWKISPDEWIAMGRAIVGAEN